MIEFFLVFLYYVGGVGYEKISVDYPVGSATQVRTLVQNGGFLVSALWVPYYFRLLSPQEIFEKHTPHDLKIFLEEKYGKDQVVLCLLSDPKEIIVSNHPWSNLHLTNILYSSKLKKFHTVKLGAFTAPDGYFLYRSPLLGGASEEIETLKKCPYFTESCTLCENVAGIVVIFDRGGSRFDIREVFFKTKKDQEVCEDLLSFETPHNLCGRKQYLASQVKHDFLQQKARAQVECRHHAAQKNVGRKSDWTRHDILHGEVALDIAYALANRQTFTPFELQEKVDLSDVIKKHACDLFKRYSPLSPPSLLPPPLLSSPHSFEKVKDLFKGLLDAIPIDWEVVFYF